jgi:hypothetical protein
MILFGILRVNNSSLKEKGSDLAVLVNNDKHDLPFSDFSFFISAIAHSIADLVEICFPIIEIVLSLLSNYSVVFTLVAFLRTTNAIKMLFYRLWTVQIINFSGCVV